MEKYKLMNPDCFAYDKLEKVFKATDKFRPQLTSGSIEEYLFFTDHNNFIEDVSTQLSIEKLILPSRNIDPYLVRKIINACRDQERLDIAYLSLKSGDMEARIIAPHTLVNDGLRWHVRAYCEKNKAFRDFVLSRFHSEVDECVYKVATHTVKDDNEWNKWVEIVIQPDPRLTSIQRKCIEIDYMMENGVLAIPCRAALIKYLLQRLNLHALHHQPEGQQIIVESNCWQQIEPYRIN
ncbi:WYL domain-containing protein [Saccharobesus litoralis]|uniref:WYL domain-containing protein n=1 Tax=Saccharobesus litoralis TaxID=2172099 RepID=A0A2S0VWI5_9ALTE|nr:WYL domain-containing protein [Saccharobesus litoralis]AWB68460.1 WYL domain-containing protein [Saccharobesus litoralis]